MGPGGSASPSATGRPRPPRLSHLAWCFGVSCAAATRPCWPPVLDGPALARMSTRAPTRVQEDNALDHEHDSAPAVARLLPVASPPRRLRGVLPTCVVGNVILERASHLDAFIGSPN